MMINKRLIETVSESKKYIAGNVACQWISLVANIVMMANITGFFAKLFEKTAETRHFIITLMVAMVTLAVRYICTTFETVIISCTVLIMCPLMSFLAAWMYYPYYTGFSILTLLANWLKLICFNFPFAFFSQIFFIQPFVRGAFRKIFAKDIAARNSQELPERPQNEQEAIADIYRRMDEIQENLAHERRQRKKLAEQISSQGSK
ncbi:MAG: hypothetical protein PUG54_12485 [Firmicutes bacterium]|nr:hypothetical protein [Bacillota bacterium]